MSDSEDEGVIEDLPAVTYDEEVEGGALAESKGKKVRKKKKVLTEEQMRRMKEEAEMRGVVYISRLPPHMKPMKIRELLSRHGELGRVYLAPEDARARERRIKRGGDTGKNFTEGWVEFNDKRVAKRTALLLNGRQMGGKRRSAYYSDLWAIKYLSKFKWDHLTEEIAYQARVREQKQAAEISAAKKERDFYLARVDQSKALDAMEARKAAKGGGKTDGGKEGGAGGVKVVRNFQQRQAKLDTVTDDRAPMLSAGVLGKVLGGVKKRKSSG